MLEGLWLTAEWSSTRFLLHSLGLEAEEQALEWFHLLKPSSLIQLLVKSIQLEEEDEGVEAPTWVGSELERFRKAKTKENQIGFSPQQKLSRTKRQKLSRTKRKKPIVSIFITFLYKKQSVGRNERTKSPFYADRAKRGSFDTNAMAAMMQARVKPVFLSFFFFFFFFF